MSGSGVGKKSSVRVKKGPEKPVDKETEKIWRAMKVKRVFSCTEIAGLANASQTDVHGLFRAYKADGYIRNAGVRPSRTGRDCEPEKLFRLTVKGQNRARQPDVASFKTDPLAGDAIELNRLVCSRLVIRDDNAAKEAIRICRRMIKTLNAEMES
ncbi:MAG: hypothetical protein MI862_22380 [Desulfobacterales bacterium]|nr:hypothetical protein [Desulfobacterales bacterium]